MQIGINFTPATRKSLQSFLSKAGVIPAIGTHSMDHALGYRVDTQAKKIVAYTSRNDFYGRSNLDNITDKSFVWPKESIQILNAVRPHRTRDSKGRFTNISCVRTGRSDAVEKHEFRVTVGGTELDVTVWVDSKGKFIDEQIRDKEGFEVDSQEILDKILDFLDTNWHKV